jgi:hypothetical protein
MNNIKRKRNLKNGTIQKSLLFEIYYYENSGGIHFKN